MRTRFQLGLDELREKLLRMGGLPNKLWIEPARLIATGIYHAANSSSKMRA